MLDNIDVVFDNILSDSLIVIGVVAAIWMIIMIIRMIKEIRLKKKKEVWHGSLMVSCILFFIAVVGIASGLWFDGFEFWGMVPQQ